MPFVQKTFAVNTLEYHVATLERDLLGFDTKIKKYKDSYRRYLDDFYACDSEKLMLLVFRLRAGNPNQVDLFVQPLNAEGYRLMMNKIPHYAA